MKKIPIWKLSQILRDYNRDEKKADKEFYKKVFELLSDGLENYVNDLLIIPKDDMNNPKYAKYTEGFAGMFGQAAYVAEERRLVIYERNIEYSKDMEIRSSKYQGKNLIALYNLLILQTILHEFEHARQKYEEIESDSLEGELFRVMQTAIKPQTTATYDYDPKERLAEIKSYQKLLVLYKFLGIKDFELYNLLQNNLIDRVAHGYGYLNEQGYMSENPEGKFTSPTEFYLYTRGCDIKKSQAIISKLSSKDKLTYGTQMTVEEYEQKFGEGRIKRNYAL